MNFESAPLTIEVLRAIAAHGPISLPDIEELPELAGLLPAAGGKGFVGWLRDQGHVEWERQPPCKISFYVITSKGRRMLTRVDSLAAGAQAAGPRTCVTSGAYVPLELRPYSARAGALNAFSLNSVVNGQPAPRARPILMSSSQVKPC